MAIDWTDPCARAEALRNAYYALLSGSRAQSISYSDGNQARSISYSNTTVDLNRLKAELVEAEKECAGEATGTGMRYAITGGALNRG